MAPPLAPGPLGHRGGALINTPLMGFLPCLSHLPHPLPVLPRIVSQKKVLHLNSGFRVCLRGNPNEDNSELPTFIEHFLCAKHPAQYFACFNSFNPMTARAVRKEPSQLHFTDTELAQSCGLMPNDASQDPSAHSLNCFWVLNPLCSLTSCPLPSVARSTTWPHSRSEVEPPGSRAGPQAWSPQLHPCGRWTRRPSAQPIRHPCLFLSIS